MAKKKKAEDEERSKGGKGKLIVAGVVAAVAEATGATLRA